MEQLVLVIIFLLLSAFFSGIETAFASANKLKIEVDKSRDQLTSSILSRFINNQSLFISTLWFGNMVAMIAYSIYASKLVETELLKIIMPGYTTLLLTITVEIIIISVVYFLVAALIPKTLFRLNPDGILRVFAVPVYIVYLLFYPIIRLFILLAEFILRYLFRAKIDRQDYTFSSIDLDKLLDETTIEPTQENEEFQELQMFRNARDLSNIKLRDFMIPRNEIVAIGKDESLDNLSNLIVESGHSKILVYDQSIDNIIGYSHSYDIFAKPASLSEIIKPVIIVPGTMNADRLLNTFILERRSVALVVDEFGGTDGMLTIEDILEEIFGDIDDEYDVEEFVNKQISEYEYLVSGRLEIDYLNEEYNLGLPESDDYNTIAGYVIFNHENIPSADEEIQIGNLTFVIMKATESRIELVLIRINHE